MPYVVTDTCILCGACVVGCESEAITEGDTQSHIDIDICVECGTCMRNCPTESIIYIDDDECARMHAQPADAQTIESPSPSATQPTEQPVRKNTERTADQKISQPSFL
jgi:NAD-dependent dihydropyrimidine dehydrogenase PreA subunit